MDKKHRLIDFVNPFLGVDGQGNCLPGPYLPLSLVRLSPDVLPPQPTSGYRTNRPIVCFSHTHVSGTGGVGRFGNIGVTPFLGLPRMSVDPFERQDERAEAGYYGVTLQPAGIKVELTSTPRTGAHRYVFPKDTKANILIDVGAVIRVSGLVHCKTLRTPGPDRIGQTVFPKLTECLESVE